MLQGTITDNYGNQLLVSIDIVVVAGNERNPFSVRTTSKKSIVTIFDYESPSVEGSTSQCRHGERAVLDCAELEYEWIWCQGSSKERSR